MSVAETAKTVKTQIVVKTATRELKMPARKRRKAPAKKPVPTNKKLYARVKAEAKRRFKVYPSAYANGWLVKTYKARGGKYRMGRK